MWAFSTGAGHLGVFGGLALELEEGCLDVSCHGDGHIYVDVVPLKS